MASSRKTSKIRVWRLVSKGSDYDPFSGKGALKSGGCWNFKGTTMLYASTSISLAMLEILANLRGIRNNLTYLAYWIDIPEKECLELKPSLFENLFNRNNISITREIGSDWIDSQKSLALKVPSIVNKHEYNFLINPFHSDFNKKLNFASKKDVKEIELDPRLVKHVETLRNH